MDAQEFANALRDDKSVIRLAKFDDNGGCIGRGYGLVVDDDENVAVMLSCCGVPRDAKNEHRAITSFIEHPEGEPKIVDRPAYWGQRVTGGSRVN